MYKMAVVGEPWAVWGFAALGLSIYPVRTEKEAQDILETMKENYAIIFVTETFLKVVEDKFQFKGEGRFPKICLIPNHRERRKSGHALIQEVVRRAVGFEI